MLTTGGGMSGTIPDTAGGGVYVGSSPPSSALTNKVWYKTDGGGRPLGVYMFYNGNWRKVYTGVVFGEIRLYWGTFSVFDGTGRGLIGGDADGWAVCNGQNGTTNLEGYFPCGGSWNGSNWVTSTNGVTTNAGGARGPHMIDRTKLPALHTVAYGALVAAAGAGAYAAANLGQTPVGTWPLLDASGNSIDGAGQQPIPFPPFVAMALLQFIGYQ
jgi:hypothetical protein